MDLDLWLVTAVDEDRQVVVAAAGTWASRIEAGTSFPWEESFCRRMVERQGPTVAPDVAVLAVYAELAAGPHRDVKAYVGVPLEGDAGAVFGTLCGFAGTAQPDELVKSLPSVQLLGRMLSTILAREQFAQARSEEAAMAYALVERDATTSLRNRRGWDSALQQEDLRCQRYGGTASVLVLDLDDVPLDGRDAGTERLVRAAGVLSSTCRPGDVLARLGGDDFAVLALECDPVAARALLARLRVHLRTAGITATTGVATRRVGERFSDVCARAEEEARRDRRRRDRASPLGPAAS